MITKEEIGKIIKKARELKGLKVLDLSREVNVSSGRVSDIEAGRYYPTLKTLEKFMKALDIPYTKFFNDKNKEDIFSKSDSRLIKYVKVLETIEKDSDFSDFILHFTENRETFKNLKYTQILKELSNFTPDKQKEILAQLKKTMKIAKGKK